LQLLSWSWTNRRKQTSTMAVSNNSLFAIYVQTNISVEVHKNPFIHPDKMLQNRLSTHEQWSDLSCFIFWPVSETYSRQTRRWSLRGVNILSAVRREYRTCRCTEDFLLVSAKVT
jgi:hypothetical protein